jgi:fucose permease
MGFGDASGQLVSVVEKAFGITPFMASLVSFSGMIMFGFLSIPLGIVQSRTGKKNILLLGLVFFLFGALLPVVEFSFPVILLAVLLMGAGAAMLQVSGQPIMRDVSPSGKFSRNLSFAQSVKAIGTLSTSLIIFLIGTKLMQHSWFTVPAVDGSLYNAGFRILFPIFAVILFLTLIFIFPLKIKRKTDESAMPATVSSCFNALKTPFIASMVIGIFLYCGAEASLFNRVPGLLEQAGYVYSSIVGNIVLILALVVGRFGGGVILNRMKPVIFLIFTSILAIIGNLMFFLPGSHTMLWVAIGLTGIAIANIFPLIFSITVDKFPDKANEISGLMVTAIVGAAIVPILTGYIANTSLIHSFCVPLACIFYVLFTALSVKNKIR